MWRLTVTLPTRVRTAARRDLEAGGVALLVAILAGGGVLLGMAALTVDVGRLLAERRQVQNGADAAALAVAMDCARYPTCDTSLTGTARSLADANANDAATRVIGVCGSGVTGLPGCPPQTGPELSRCPDQPAGVAGFVRVRTATARSGGGTLLPPAFAQAMAGNEGYAGSEVGACAQAAWGAPGVLTTLPVTLSMCEWDAATNNGTSFVTPPPYPPYPPASQEKALKLHATDERGGCPSHGGAYADLPGGFGWLDGPGCSVTVDATGIAKADTGVSGSSCSSTLAANVGKTVFLPVYSEAWGTGSGGRYRISGFAAFYLTGYNIPGAGRVDSPVGGRLCTGSNKCIYGYFVEALSPSAGSSGSGPDRGLYVVSLTG